jgi:hypothetical protein
MKTFLKKLGLFLGAVVLFAIVACVSVNEYPRIDPARIKRPVEDITDSMDINYSVWKEKYGTNKEMPPQYEKQILCALSYYPELANTRIRFVIKKSTGGIISSHPSFTSFFKRSSKRTYLVIINDSTEGRVIPTFSNGDANGQVGVVGHELCHIIYSNNQTAIGLMGLGIRELLSKTYLDSEEYRTDSMDVERGLGYQLISWEKYLWKGFTALHPVDTAFLKKSIIHKRYMDVEDVQRVMAKSDLYK